MPLALLLISALVMGVTLPVATTFLAMVSRLTSASLDLSMVLLPLTAATNTRTATTTARLTPPMIRNRFLRLLLPLPFAMAAFSSNLSPQHPLGKAFWRRGLVTDTKQSPAKFHEASQRTAL